MNANTLFLLFGLGTMIFGFVAIMTWLVFGRLIWLQIKRWLLASKGYVEVEHISATKVRNYFIMKPVDNKFDFEDGFYHFIPECVTRKGDIIKKADKSFFTKEPKIDPVELEGLTDKEKEDYIKRNKAEWEEVRGLYNVIQKIKYDPQLLNRKFGMPVITYYADSPDPMNPANREKVYGSGVIKDMYLRLLLTQRYKDFRFMMILFLVAFILTAVAVTGLWRMLYSKDIINLNCQLMLNQSINNYQELANRTITTLSQGSSFVVG